MLTEVGDHQAVVSSLKTSEFFATFKDLATIWEVRLAMLTDSLAHLASIQRKWLYLEPIFRRGALASEASLFRKLDGEFRGIMRDVSADPLVVSFAERQHLVALLPNLEKGLDHCQNKLSEFLEGKRAEFPRFYFIGDDDVLEILGQAKNPEVIQAHLKKLFAGINTVEFAEGYGAIHTMVSAEGERVQLSSPVAVTDKIEEWLGDLTARMQGTLAGLLREAVAKGDVNKHPSQILSLAEQVYFTNGCEAALALGGGAGVKAVLEDVHRKLADYTGAMAAAGAPGQTSAVTTLKVRPVLSGGWRAVSYQRCGSSRPLGRRKGGE